MRRIFLIAFLGPMLASSAFGWGCEGHQIVALIARRVAYVRKAADFKTSSASVAAPERVAAVLKTRRQWAEAAGLGGDVIEALYRDLVAYCVSEEHKQWEANHAG